LRQIGHAGTIASAAQVLKKVSIKALKGSRTKRLPF
jgi:hypothetical protein